jgi:transposase
MTGRSDYKRGTELDRLRKRAAKLYTGGASISDVAAKIGRSRTRVHQLLEEAGVSRRPIGVHEKKRRK